MELVQIQRSNNRSVLGSMNDFALSLKWQVEDRFDFSRANDLEDLLSETPMGALKYNYPSMLPATYSVSNVNSPLSFHQIKIIF